MTEQEKRGWFARLKEILYGMGAHDMSRYALRTRASMEHLFILITMGDLIGVPILPPYYSLRLLPYVDRKSTRLNSSHLVISYAVFCLKKKKKKEEDIAIESDYKMTLDRDRVMESTKI